MKITNYVKMICLFYKNISLEKISFIARKMKSDNPFRMHLICESLKLFSSILMIILLYNNVYSYNTNLFVSILLLIYLVQNLLMLVGPWKIIRKRFKYSYLRMTASGDCMYLRKVIVLNFFVEYLLSLPMNLPILIGLIVTANLFAVLLAINISALSFLFYIIRHSQKMLRKGPMATIMFFVSRMCTFSIGYLFAFILSRLVLISRSGIKEFGLSVMYVSWVDSIINDSLFSITKYFRNILLNVDYYLVNDYRIISFLLILILFFVFISLMILKRISKEIIQITYKLPNCYINSLSKFENKHEIDNPFLFKDLCIFIDKTRKLEYSPMEFLFTNELFFFIGINIVFLPLINNYFIFAFLFVFELFFLIDHQIHP